MNAKGDWTSVIRANISFPRSASFNRGARVVLLAFFGLFCGLGVTANATESNSALPSILAGAQTRGGAAANASIITVTNLADSGAGSLRAAIESKGPRILIFNVAGAIWLKSDLIITSPYITIAGQTAPSPGITLFGATLAVRTHNVVLQHIAVRPGGSIEPEINQIRDAISISSCADCRSPSQDVRLENVSASWATDEVIGTWGRTLARVTIRNSIISEALNRAGHPKGAHSKGLLIGQHAQGITIAGNLFANNENRNPVISTGASVFVANNYIYNPGSAAVHFFRGPLIRASIVGNVAQRGPNSHKKLRAVNAPRNFRQRSPGAQVYVSDNRCCSNLEKSEMPGQFAASLVDFAPVKTSAWTTIPAGSVWNHVKRYAGKRPTDRDSIDKRIVESVENDTGRIIDHPEDSGGPLSMATASHHLKLPANPFAFADNTGGVRRIELWLCAMHLEVGGPPTPECPKGLEFYQERLTQ